MNPFSRADRVGGLIQEALSELLHKEISDPRLKSATITHVKMSRDLRLATVYFSTLGSKKDSEEAAKGFKSALGYLKRSLATMLDLRYMPDIRFFYDESLEYGPHINQILKSISTDNEPDNSSN